MNDVTRSEPLKHLRMHPEQYCPLWIKGDKVFVIGNTYTEGDWGENYTPCPHCWPKPTSEVKP